MAKLGNPLLSEPEHDPNDAMMVCVIYLKGQKITFNIKIPGFEGTVPESRHNEQSIARMVVEALRTKFGLRVEKV